LERSRDLQKIRWWYFGAITDFIWPKRDSGANIATTKKYCGCHLIVRAPGYKKGVRSEHLTELVDVYPTLCDLAGLEKPFQLQGNSLVPLLNGENPSWKDAVYCRWVKGETIVTKDRTYTAWFNQPEDSPFARMMYNYATDPEETVNISEVPGNSSEVKELHQKLIRHLEERERLVLP
jgi:iduronate 2-sulfatase